jgi:hypothetical protein
VILQLLRRRWHREDETEQKPTEMQMILQEGENFVQELRATIALIQEAQDEHCAQLQNKTESVTETMKVNARHLVQFQNVMDLVKMIKARDEHLSQLQNQMDLIEKAMQTEDEHRAQIQKDMHSMKMMVWRWLSVVTERMVGDPAPVESPVKMRTPRKSYTVASNAAAEKKKKVTVSKIPVRLVPLQNVKAVTSKRGSRDNVSYKPGGSHVKMHIQKLVSSKTQAVRAKVIQGGPTI